MKNHPLIHTLINLRGNARGCVYTEPLWGIPYNLYAPYASLYMLALGLTDSQIGWITSIALAFQVLWSILGGAITDKLGRKRTTLIFDLLSWSIPALIYAVAQNVTYFVVAALINSLWRVVHTSWACLLVEDTDPDILVDVFSWTNIAGLLAAFVSPLTGLFIKRFDLVPTIRVLYLLAFVMMTIKAFTTNALVTETRQGKVRMQETQEQPLFAVLREYPALIRRILSSRVTLMTAGLMLILSICWMIRGTFWSILVTEKLQIPTEHLAFYPFARSVTMLLFFFLIMPRMRSLDLRWPMLAGFVGLIVSQIMLLASPTGNYLVILVATVLEACSVPTANILLEKLVVVTVDAAERARIMALLYTAILLFTSPFGWIAGRLSELDRSLPFILNLALFALGGLLTYFTSRLIKGRISVGETTQKVAPAWQRHTTEGGPVDKVNLTEALSRIDAYWSPHIAGELNGQHIKLAKLKGEFLWHHHQDEDELFLVIQGQLVIQFRERDVVLNPGEFLIVPRGLEHKPVAGQEVHVLLFEPVSTLNTGNVRNERTVEHSPTI